MTLYHKVCWINHVGVIKLDEKRKENLKNNRLREEKVIRSLWRVFRRFKIFHRRTTGSEDLAPLCSDFKCISKFPSDLARFLVRQCEGGKKKKRGKSKFERNLIFEGVFVAKETFIGKRGIFGGNFLQERAERSLKNNFR